ncbi:MAG: MFS transporter [Solirubrobacteraceae bacterium]|nr:MFS transporter [Solirubrobacteraceae bacterium]
MQLPAVDPSQRPRLALAALALGTFAIGTTEFVAMGVLPQIADGISVSIPSAGHVISAYALGVFVGAPLLAGAGARFPRRRLLVWLMLAYAVGNLVSALAPSYETLMIGRFVSGLPHGAYFGVAALAAMDLAPPARKASAVALVFLGLSVANVVGVPVATWMGQGFGWRAAFALGGGLALATALAVSRLVPRTPANPTATFRRELRALKRPQVWLAVGTGAIGGGGLFAVYTYISPILTDRTGMSEALVPVVLAVWGLGMVTGNLVGGRVLDRWPVRGLFALFTYQVAVFALFAVTSATPLLAVPTVFLMGMAIAVAPGLQMRLMEVAGDAQTLAAAMNHSAFNAANALGAALGGVVIAAGLGLTAPMWVAVGLSVGGMAILAVAVVLQRGVGAPAEASVASASG